MGGRSTAVQRIEEPARIKTTRGDPFERTAEVVDAISRRAFELFENNGRTFGHDVEDWINAEKELLQPMPINIAETGESFEVKAEVPGFNEKELEVNVEPRRVTITGKRETSQEEKKDEMVYSETRSDRVFRVIDLPAEVEIEKAAATLKNGVLQLTLPKAGKARTLQVEPKAGA